MHRSLELQRPALPSSLVCADGDAVYGCRPGGEMRPPAGGAVLLGEQHHWSLGLGAPAGALFRIDGAQALEEGLLGIGKGVA